MVARKNKVVSNLVKGIATLFKTWNIEHIEGTGELIDTRTLRISKRDGTETQVVAEGVIIATGSSWPNLPLFPIEGTQIITSKQALDLVTIPASFLIVGGGVEGCEFAFLYSELGAQVTMVELLPRLLPLEDEEIGQMMQRELKKRGVDIHTGITVDQIVRQPDVVTAHLRDGLSFNVEQVLVSVGRGFNSRGIDLEKVGVEVGSRGEVLVNERMETNVTGVYTIGDVVGKGRSRPRTFLAILERSTMMSSRRASLRYQRLGGSGSRNNRPMTGASIRQGPATGAQDRAFSLRRIRQSPGDGRYSGSRESHCRGGYRSNSRRTYLGSPCD